MRLSSSVVVLLVLSLFRVILHCWMLTDYCLCNYREWTEHLVWLMDGADLADQVAKYGMSFHAYADDTQLYQLALLLQCNLIICRPTWTLHPGHRPLDVCLPTDLNSMPTRRNCCSPAQATTVLHWVASFQYSTLEPTLSLPAAMFICWHRHLFWSEPGSPRHSHLHGLLLPTPSTLT